VPEGGGGVVWGGVVVGGGRLVVGGWVVDCDGDGECDGLAEAELDGDGDGDGAGGGDGLGDGVVEGGVVTTTSRNGLPFPPGVRYATTWTPMAPTNRTIPSTFSEPVSRRSPNQTTSAPATPINNATTLPIRAEV
jgi:hypothetical protein